MALAAFKQCKLCGVVQHGELLEQGLNDLTGAGARADVQVLGRVLGQVEGGAALQGAPRCRLATAGGLLGRRALPGRWHRHRAYQLQMDLDEARVRTIFVL